MRNMWLNAIVVILTAAIAVAAYLILHPYPIDRTRYEAEIPNPTTLTEGYARFKIFFSHFPRCLPSGPRFCGYDAPFQFVQNQNREEKRSDIYPVIGFAPLENLKKDKELLELEKRVGSKEPIECDESHCSYARYGFDPHYKDVNVILVCSYQRLSSGGSGAGFLAPDCEPVMIKERSGRSWALALLGWELPPSAVIGILELGSFPVAMTGNLPDENVVSAAVSDALAKPILSLIPANTPIHNQRVAGVAGRNSPVIPPFREQTKVSVVIERGKDHNRQPFIGFWVNLTLYVNRYNTDAENDWHLPSRRQEETYENAVRDSLFNRLKSACRGRPDPRGPFVLRCE
jgi:hypothetical protein